MFVRNFHLLVVFLGVLFEAQILHSQNLVCDSDDLRALEDVFKGMDSKIHGWGTNFSTNCCIWTGITCNSSLIIGINDSLETGKVVKIDLGRKRLTGKLSDSIGRLDQLRFLNLSQNFLKNFLPPSLFQLPELEVLDLSSNDLTGVVPATFNLPAIQLLDMSNNYFDGSLPPDLCHNSSRIRVLDLGFNYLSGNLPPELGNCTSLETFSMETNDLTGAIPDELFRLQNLTFLSLRDNLISGQLSKLIGNLPNLVRFDISYNRFSGEFPDVFYYVKNLEFFVAESNKFTGRIPNSLSSSPTLNLLNLRNNSLSGPIDINCSAMANLTSLDLGTNWFSGPLPSNLPSCQWLKNINLARNNFSGEVPETFKNFQSLSYLSLSNSSIVNLGSALNILQNCKNLSTLVLTLNFHGEELPSDPSLSFENLKVFIVASCKLKGGMPPWLRGSSKLQLLDLSWNRLGGSIPDWIGNFQLLFYLDLSNNSFTGEIPVSITTLPSLINRTISFEEPSPDFPFFMKRNVSGPLKYTQVLSFPPTLELSNNNLSGPIWSEFGNLRKLHVFDLKFNNLSGEIPGSLAEMTSLENLDLSHNKLTGIIPQSLVRLSFLSKFSVAFNQLSGVVPVGGQFQTFPNSSFEGNRICILHTSSPCSSNDQNSFDSPGKSSGSRGSIIGMAVGISIGSVFVLILLILIVVRTRSRRDRDLETEDVNSDHKYLEEFGVVLFENQERNKGLTIDDLLKSTDNFDQANIIGCGGFGLVYKANLLDGRRVAIKRLSGDCGQIEREFLAEVETLSRAQHPNLVLLQGYCIYRNDRLLIYSYMENGSLDYWLHEKYDGPSFLDWDTRLRIARGAVEGLAYLHQSCEPHILHRDIKSSNILLDENFIAHLADFGLARLIHPYDTHVTTDLVGTLGYIPPEYGQASVATYKGDVYSLGVVFLELLTGKRPMDICKPKGCRDLTSWVFEMKKQGNETKVYDPFIYEKHHENQMSRVLEIACRCLSENPKNRPSTEQLVSWLDNAMIV